MVGEPGDVRLALGARGRQRSLLGLRTGDDLAQLGGSVRRARGPTLHLEPRGAELLEERAILIGKTCEPVECRERLAERLRGEDDRQRVDLPEHVQLAQSVGQPPLGFLDVRPGKLQRVARGGLLALERRALRGEAASRLSVRASRVSRA